MTSVTAKMGGLQVEQTTEFYGITNYPTNVTTNQKQNVPVGYVTVCDPQFINETIIKLAGTDEKFYFRQEKLTGMMHNASATDVFVDLYYMSCRKNVPKSEFSSLNALLTDNAILTNWWLTNVTSGNTAQRYVKFGKHKRIVLRSGHVRKFSLRSPKFPANRLISQDVEANVNFLGTKGWTKWCFIKVTPPPFNYFSAGVVEQVPTVQGCLVNFVLSRYTSWYQLGNNNPSAVYSKDFGTPTGTGDPHAWTDTSIQPVGPP